MRNLFFGTCFLLFAACGAPDGSPEQALREWVARGETAAEEKDRRGVLQMISARYADARGNDHERIGDLLRMYFLRQQSIVLLTNIENIDITGDSAALVSLTVGMAGTDGSMLGINADTYRFELELEMSDDEWLLIGARWGEPGSELR